MPKSPTADELASVGLFVSLAPSDREEVASMMEVQMVDEGDFVVEKGDLSYKLLVILDGRAQVENDASPIATLGPGDYFGETGIVRAAYRNAAVRALTPLRLGVLVGWEVKDLMHRFPGVKASIDATVANRS
ncbi:MAG: cyclic nucleotide-binding domain-containing protein [Actinobacteria bacterium]|nr:cyclic nucleotide-binding domain-containing protein [Actinomycetota bacterium]